MYKYGRYVSGMSVVRGFIKHIVLWRRRVVLDKCNSESRPDTFEA
jgi:hypothetical protein